MTFIVPAGLIESCRTSVLRSVWLTRLPGIVTELGRRWSLAIDAPFDGEGSCAWVAPVTRANGSKAVLKIGMPHHMEGEHEIDGLRHWAGNPTVKLLEADDSLDAMLLERCIPGTALRELPEPEQDVIIAGLLRRLWRVPSDVFTFRPLSAMTAFWSNETLQRSAHWSDVTLVHQGLALFKELSRSAPAQVLLATDLHAGNVLRAERQPWLVIDPKPFVGDPAYDATQHLMNCRNRLRADPFGTIHRFADLLEVDRQRVQLWLFARLAAEPRQTWHEDALTVIARTIAPENRARSSV